VSAAPFVSVVGASHESVALPVLADALLGAEEPEAAAPVELLLEP
jgi:hypothetical protein